MSRKVRLLPRAQKDLERLAAFLAELSPKAAQRMTRDVRAAIESLRDNPTRGRPGPSPRQREITPRFGKVGYVVRYRVSSDEVVVTRIWHGRERRR